MRPAQGKELAPGLSVMRADLDAATSTSADVQEAQWRAGVNRQAQPGAALHQHAASAAAAAKRVATAMTGDEKEAAERCRADRRNAAKRKRRAAAAGEAIAPTAVSDLGPDHTRCGIWHLDVTHLTVI